MRALLAPIPLFLVYGLFLGVRFGLSWSFARDLEDFLQDLGGIQLDLA